ncbi:MAG: WD40/YVTN/BNR-like repeat-containing protein [Acidithiobacillales bacterium]
MSQVSPRRRSAFAAAILATLSGGLAVSATSVPAPPAEKPRTLSDQMEGLEFRLVGPFRGGRVVAVTGVVAKPLTFYFGGTGGGVWKTADGGQSWEPVSDKFFRTGSVGAIAVAEADPNVVYAGMGEACIRGNVSSGDGVWKSTDAGKTWKHVGLTETQQISAVVVHPRNPDLVYVAALGHAWGPNPERGIFRSSDGGATWKKVLFVDDKTGASSLSMDPTNPRILYAGFWQVVRKPWTLESGGPGSGLWKSTDGGDTWKKLAGGLPEGIVGKIGVAVSPARPDRVWAMVEAEMGGLFRSDDGGGKWTRVNEDNRLRQRAWYYTHVTADPKNPDTVWVLNVQCLKSVDGGKSFTPVRTPHGDNHALWIDPDDPDRMIEGNDGGATVTFDGGRSWSSVLNQPTAQFYRVITDNRVPYRIYGAQQDNTTVSIASRTRGFGIGLTDWYDVGGCESGWVAPDPKNPDLVYAGCYGGSITRYNHRTGERREVVAWPQLAVGQAAKDLKYRFQWDAPILISPNDPKVLYHAAQKLLRSTDGGQTWTEISPDLTRNDPAKEGKSGGPITKDDTGVEIYDTIFALAESPLEAGVIWAGTDDGLVWATRDGGENWANVTPKGIPEWIQINAIDASPHQKGTAYVAATMYKFDDDRPFLYKTNDYGKSWTKIVSGIPAGAFTRVVREDTARRGLLYCGTETGLYLSFDDGSSWQPFQRNLPLVPITDLAVKGDDLVVATQGRSFWVLDDVGPLRPWKPEIASRDVHLFAPRPSIRMEGGTPWWMEGEKPRGVGQNPANGVTIDYWLKEKPVEKPKGKDVLKIEILDGDTVLRTFTSEKPPEHENGAPPPEEVREKPLEPKQGVNRFVWDTRMLRPQLVPKAVLWGNRLGPKVAPGTYKVRLTKGDTVLTESFEIRPHPEHQVSAADLAQQAVFLRDIRDRITDTHEAVVKIRDVKAQLKEVATRAEKLGKKEPVSAKAKALTEKLEAIEKKLVNPKLKAPQDILNFTPALDHQFVGIATAAGSADGAPRPVEREYYAELKAKLDALLSEMNGLLGKDLADFNAAVRDAGIPPVAVLPIEEKK